MNADDDVARNTTGRVVTATTSGGDEETNKKNTMEGAFTDGMEEHGGKIPGTENSAAGTKADEYADATADAARNTTGRVATATTSGGDEETNKKNTMEGAFTGGMVDGGKIAGSTSSDNLAAGTKVDEMNADEDVANNTTRGVAMMTTAGGDEENKKK